MPAMFAKRERYLLKGYRVDDRICYGTGQIVASAEVPAAAARILARDEVAYVHVRSALEQLLSMPHRPNVTAAGGWNQRPVAGLSAQKPGSTDHDQLRVCLQRVSSAVIHSERQREGSIEDLHRRRAECGDEGGGF
jgi:uncharacterized protein DUF1203